MGVRDDVKMFLLANPAATSSEAAKATGASKRTVFLAKKDLIDAGQMERVRYDHKRRAAKSSPEGAMMDGETLRAIAANTDLVDDLVDEAATRDKLLRQVQRMALDPMLPADLRLSATQVWVKVKDIARTKDLGPGPPRTEEEILARLTRLLQAVGPKIALKALNMVFGKGETDEKASSQPSVSSEGTSEDSNSA